MVEESGVVVRRRSRAEIARIASMYRTSGMGRREFCRSHGLALSSLSRHLKKQAKEQKQDGGDLANASRLMRVELAATLAADATGKSSDILTVLLFNGRRVEVGRDFDAETLSHLVNVLERL
jgi:transposase-like protein